MITFLRDLSGGIIFRPNKTASIHSDLYTFWNNNDIFNENQRNNLDYLYSEYAKYILEELSIYKQINGSPWK